MAATPSTMRELGSPLPAFQLTDTRSGESVTDAYLRGRGPAVVAFICNHCPFVVHIRAGLVEFGRYCQEAGVPFIAVSSNDVTTHPQDGPDAMAVEAKRHGFTFPYLYDETQDLARAFDAACTPDFFVFDGAGKLAYRGQFDASRPSIGCNIKWKR